jgi:hypothetical protein
MAGEAHERQQFWCPLTLTTNHENRGKLARCACRHRRAHALKAAAKRAGWRGSALPWMRREAESRQRPSLACACAQRGAICAVRFLSRLKFAALGAKHSLWLVPRCSEFLQHTAAFWRDGSQPRHSCVLWRWFLFVRCAAPRGFGWRLPSSIFSEPRSSTCIRRRYE